MKNRVKIIEEYLTKYFAGDAQNILNGQVRDLKVCEADSINDGGLIEQIKYLIGELGADYVEGFAHALVAADQAQRKREAKHEPPA